MKFWRFAASILLVAAIVALYNVVLTVNNTTVALTLLLAVLAVSAVWGLAEATVASIVAVLGFNYYFLPPVHTFTIEDPQNWVALGAFLVTAVTASQLSVRVRRRAAESETRRLEIERLYELVQHMMLTGGARKTIGEFVAGAIRVFGFRAAAFYYKVSGDFVRSGSESKPVSDHDLLAACELDDVSIDAERELVMAPVRFGGRPLGSLALIGPPPSVQVVGSLINLLALAIEKARALEEASHAEAARQSEVFKSALLDSLAHDIRTPLTSIKAAVTSLLGSAAGDHELLTIINEEADRLNQLTAEVVEMARIEAGKLHLEKRRIGVVDLVSQVMAELGSVLKDRQVTVRIADGIPDAEADPELAPQVLKQFLENAAKYTPPEAPLSVTAECKNAKIVFGVADKGPGIEPNERALIFDKFYRGRRHRFATKGTGMGLAIAKAIVEAHGEKVWVESEPGDGSVFCFTLAASGDRRP
jgi:two-component system, OmpR family, sensor histidine kinase KdpD